MSTADGARSLQGASEETFEHVCDPCHYRGMQKEATNFCNDCQEMLCRHCTDAHKGLKFCRNHKILTVGDASIMTTNKPSSGCIVLCDCSQNLEVSVYCENHNDVSCQACKTIKHRKCKTVPVSEKSFSYSNAKFSILDQKANQLNSEIDDIIRETKSTLKALTSQKEKVKTDIRNFRNEINRQMDLMEQNILKELNQHNLLDQQEADRCISSYTTTKQMLQTDLKLLNDATTTGFKVDMFAADVKISKRLTEYKRLLQDVCQECKFLCLTFQRNGQLVDVLRTIKVMGKLTKESVYLTWLERQIFSDLKSKNTKQVDVRLPGDQQDPDISGCVFLPDGQAILCDRNNNKLKLLSKSFTREGSLDLPACPCDISVVNNKTVIVTLPERRELQYIEVVPTLKLGRVLQLDQQCLGVEVADGDIYVTCHKDVWSGGGEVTVLDQDGNVKRRLGVNRDGTAVFIRPYFLTVNIKSNKIYVSDNGRATVTCIKSDGTVVYQYKDPNLRGPRGLCVDDVDNIIICSIGSNTVHVVTAAGQKHRILLTDKDGIISPRSVAYRHTDDIMIIACYNYNKLFVCKLTHE